MAYLPIRKVLLVSGTFLAILIGSAGAAVAAHGSGAAGGICVDNSGRNVKCSHQSSGGSYRQAVRLNNIGHDLANRGLRTKSLATLRRAVAYLRRATAIAPNSIARTNLLSALASYWSLKSYYATNCKDKITYFRRGMSTTHHWPARKRQYYLGVFRRLQRSCGGQESNANRQPVRNPVTGQKGAAIGVAGAVKGNVQMCWKGKCTRVKTGATVRMGATIKTGPKGRMQVLLLDETAFTTGPYSEITLNKFDYSPLSPAGQVLAEVSRGVFRYVTGKVERKVPNQNRNINPHFPDDRVI